MIDDRRRIVTLSVSDKPHYNTPVKLLGKNLYVKCGYNSRNKLRWIIITDANGFTLLPQTFLKNNKQCEFNFLSNIYNLNFYVTLKQKNKNKELPKDYDYLNWSDDFDMFFVGSSQNLIEQMRLSLRSVYVGN